MIVLIYRDTTEGMKVGLFERLEEAEEQAFEWVEDDYGRPDDPALGDARSNEDRMEALRTMELHMSFAVDFIHIKLGQTWESD